MTDFFADLEREIRAAHPRRSRPVVPVKGIAVTAAVAATLIAVVLGLGQLIPVADREVATPKPEPQPAPVMPADCNGRVVDGSVPGALVERFGILDEDTGSQALPRERIPGIAAEVIRQSLRTVSGPGSTRYVFAVARMGDGNCEPAEHGVCLISLQSGNGFCGIPGVDPLVEHLVEEFSGGRRIVAVLADDDVQSVYVELERRGLVSEFSMESNVGFRVIPGGEDDPRVVSADAGVTEDQRLPDHCSTEPAMNVLKERLRIFREPVATDPSGIEIDLPAGWHGIFLDEARFAEFPQDDARYLAVPASDASCVTGVCLVRVGGGKTACAHVPAEGEPAVVLTLKTQSGDDAEVAVLTTDGYGPVWVTEETSGVFVAASAEPSVSFARVSGADVEDVGVKPGS